MVIDTGQIKAEMGRKGKDKKRNKKKIQEYFRIAIDMLKLCFLTFGPGMPLSQMCPDIAQWILSSEQLEYTWNRFSPSSRDGRPKIKIWTLLEHT